MYDKVFESFFFSIFIIIYSSGMIFDIFLVFPSFRNFFSCLYPRSSALFIGAKVHASGFSRINELSVSFVTGHNKIWTANRISNEVEGKLRRDRLALWSSTFFASITGERASNDPAIERARRIIRENRVKFVRMILAKFLFHTNNGSANTC